MVILAFIVKNLISVIYSMSTKISSKHSVLNYKYEGVPSVLI